MTAIRGIVPGGGRTEIRFTAERIETVSVLDDLPVKGQVENSGLFLCPGFMDIQVNGFAGVDFNRPDFSAQDLENASQSLVCTGTTRFCPTLITAGYDRLTRNILEIVAACERYPLVRDMVPAIHLEGPYINPDDGPRGAHPEKHVTEPDWEAFDRLVALSKGKIRLVTLAPEQLGGVPFIRKAVQSGIAVGIGHFAARPETIDAAVNAGAALSTHLGNGAHHELPRHANYIQKQLAHDGLMASIICDGVHLPDYFVKNLVRAKGVSNTILITDATAAAGSPPGRYTLGDLVVEAGADGILRLPGTPYLAGSTLTMNRAVMNCRRHAGIPLAAAIKMATENPARLFRGISGRFEAGARADLVLFGMEQKKIKIAEVYVAGRPQLGRH